MRSLWDVIKGPVVTEKALRLKEATQDRKQLLAFYVATDANKIEIKRAIETIFKVKVDSVRIANYKGKLKRRGRFTGYQSDWRKAYVTLQAGQANIDYGDIV
jgi:large subunit ribosomal protein L23